jgi:hypothetical protein
MTPSSSYMAHMEPGQMNVETHIQCQRSMQVHVGYREYRANSVDQRRTTKYLHTRLPSHVVASTLTHMGQNAHISSAPNNEDELACTYMIIDSKPVGLP